MLWSDESPFVLRCHNKKRVWRCANDRYNVECLQGTVKHDKRINVWGCFAASAVGRLHLIEGNMEQMQYCNILETQMVPSAVTLFQCKDWLFQQDNDPKHTAKLTRTWLEQQNVPVMVWPSQSPDLNPIENLWSAVEHMCAHRAPSSEAQLFEELQKAWGEIPPSYLDTLVSSMPARCKAVIEANGGSTKY